MNHVLSAAAERRLNEIFTYTEARFGFDQAVQYTTRLRDACAALGTYNNPGKAVEGRPGWFLKRAQHHHILYTSTVSHFLVLDFLHERMDISGRIAKLPPGN